MRITIDNHAFAAHQARAGFWLGAVTPRRESGLITVRHSVRVSAYALWKETAPPD